jgi:hypothetical protein
VRTSRYNHVFYKNYNKNAMKFKILLPFLALTGGVIFYSCKKSNDSTSTTGDKVLETYLPGNKMEIKELSLYTKDQVITDAALIQSYIDRKLSTDMKSRFYVGVTSVDVPQDNTALLFTDNGRVNVNGINEEITGYQDSLMLVSEYTSSATPRYGISSCSDLFARVPVYTPLSGCMDSSCTTYRKTSPIITDGNKAYYIPLLTYAVSTGECNFSSAEWPMVNIVDRRFQSRMNAGDTVLIQYARLPLLPKASN